MSKSKSSMKTVLVSAFAILIAAVIGTVLLTRESSETARTVGLTAIGLLVLGVVAYVILEWRKSLT